jgi:hypothetical protein
MASNGDDLADMALMSFAISSTDDGNSAVSGSPAKTASETVGSNSVPFNRCAINDLIFLILLPKKSTKRSHRDWQSAFVLLSCRSV